MKGNPRGAFITARRRLAITFGCLALAGVGVLAFVYRPRTEIVVAIDTAFAAIRPGLVARCRTFDPFGNRLTLILVPVDNAPSTLLSELQTRKLHPRAIAASPLVARALVEGAARNNSAPPAPVIALEWSPQAATSSMAPDGSAPPLAPSGATPPPSAPLQRGDASSSLAFPTASILSDPLPAARRLGTLLGSIVADLRRGTPLLGPASPSATGAIVWEGGPDRPDAERKAFEESWTAAAGLNPLELTLAQGDPNADSLLRGLFSNDIRALFVDAGALTPTALNQADGKVTVVAFASGAATDAAQAWPHAALALEPDEAAIVALLRSERATRLHGELAVASIVKLLPGATKLHDFDMAARLAAQSR